MKTNQKVSIDSNVQSPPNYDDEVQDKVAALDFHQQKGGSFCGSMTQRVMGGFESNKLFSRNTHRVPKRGTKKGSSSDPPSIPDETGTRFSLFEESESQEKQKFEFE